MLKKVALSLGVPLLAVAAALAIKLFFAAELSESSPFLFFFVSVFIGALSGGMIGGLVATALAVFVCDYYFITPGQIVFGNTLAQNLPLFLFALEGALISAICAVYRATRRVAVQGRTTQSREAESFAALIENARDYSVCLLDARGRVMSWNRGAERSEGYTEEEVVGRDFAIFYPADEVNNKTPERILHAAKSDGRYEGEGWRLRKDGSRYWAHTIVTARKKDGSDNLRGYVALVRDVSEHRQTEEALKESEERFRVLADTAPLMIWRAGSDGLYNYFSKGWLDFTDRSAAEEMGEGWYEDIHAEDLARYKQEYEQAFAARENFRSEYRLRRHKRDYRWVVNTGVPRWTASGIFIGYIGTCLDITEAKQSGDAQGRALREAGELRGRLAILLRQMPAGVLVAEAPTGAIVFANDQFDQIWRHTGETAAKLKTSQEYKGFRPTGHPYRPEEWPLARALQRGEVITDEEIDFERGDAARGTMLVSAAPVRDARGAIIAAVSIYHDITATKSAERDRAQFLARERMARKEAEIANRTKDEFLATLSHELRTPLTAILGWVRMMRTGKLDEANNLRALETIQRSAQSQAHLIDELLDVSRVVTGKLKLDVRPVELAPIVEDAVNAVRPAAEAKMIVLQLMLDAHAGAISGDPDRLHQVCWNLLSNAIKFTPKGGHVAIRLRRDVSNVELSVSDTGSGINKELLPHVFDRFRQGDSSSTRTHGGLGLGLAIVRHLVELHGGMVEADSRGEGQGATFRVMLPLISPSSSTKKTAPTIQISEPVVRPRTETKFTANRKPVGESAPNKYLMLDGIRVLVVDDEAETLNLLTAVLQKYGAEVTSATSAATAFELFKTTNPDVVVSDIQMPEENGYDLIGKIRALSAEHGGTVPAAALTAFAGVEDRMRALLAGFQIHVPKPVEPAELAAVVATLVGRNGQV